MKDLYLRFEKIFTALLPRGERLVTVALSGGADSTALLLLLDEYRARRALTLRAVHVNHGLRGEESERDESFCRALCAGRAIPLEVRRVDVARYEAESGRSPEESARVLRYRALREAAPEGVIVTAHNRGDVAETMLLRLARGSGTAGLAGIPRQNGRILRPLLSFSKGELIAWLSEKGQDFVTDSTNESDLFDRSALRRDLIPALEARFPSFERSCCRTACNIAEDEAFLRGLLPEGMPDGAALRALPPPLLKRLLLRDYGKSFDGLSEEELPKLAQTHLEALVRVIGAGVYGKSVSLPASVTALYDAAGVHFLREDDARAAFSFPLAPGLHLHGGRAFGYFDNARDCDAAAAALRGEGRTAYTAALPAILLSGELFVRSVAAGDRIRFGGMTRRASQLLRRLTPEVAQRRRYPLFCDEKGPFWIPGYPVRQEEPQNNRSFASGDAALRAGNGGASYFLYGGLEKT